MIWVVGLKATSTIRIYCMSDHVCDIIRLKEITHHNWGVARNFNVKLSISAPHYHFHGFFYISFDLFIAIHINVDVYFSFLLSFLDQKKYTRLFLTTFLMMVSTELQKKVKSKALTSAIFAFHKQDKHTHSLTLSRFRSISLLCCMFLSLFDGQTFLKITVVISWSYIN